MKTSDDDDLLRIYIGIVLCRIFILNICRWCIITPSIYDLSIIYCNSFVDNKLYVHIVDVQLLDISNVILWHPWPVIKLLYIHVVNVQLLVIIDIFLLYLVLSMFKSLILSMLYCVTHDFRCSIVRNCQCCIEFHSVDV